MRTRKPQPISEIEKTLWVGDATGAWNRGKDKYHAILLDQYKIYVELADRISARRGLANTFFLGLNTPEAVDAAERTSSTDQEY